MQTGPTCSTSSRFSFRTPADCGAGLSCVPYARCTKRPRGKFRSSWKTKSRRCFAGTAATVRQVPDPAPEARMIAPQDCSPGRKTAPEKSGPWTPTWREPGSGPSIARAQIHEKEKERSTAALRSPDQGCPVCRYIRSVGAGRGSREAVPRPAAIRDKGKVRNLDSQPGRKRNNQPAWRGRQKRRKVVTVARPVSGRPAQQSRRRVLLLRLGLSLGQSPSTPFPLRPIVTMVRDGRMTGAKERPRREARTQRPCIAVAYPLVRGVDSLARTPRKECLGAASNPGRQKGDCRQPAHLGLLPAVPDVAQPVTGAGGSPAMACGCSPSGRPPACGCTSQWLRRRY